AAGTFTLPETRVNRLSRENGPPPRPWLIIPCKFPDKSAGFYPHSTYDALFNGTDSVDAFIRENSYGKWTIRGTYDAAPVTLPSPYAAYFQNGIDLNKLADDCINAQHEIDLASFFGVHLLFNDYVGAAGLGGPRVVNVHGAAR